MTYTQTPTRSLTPGSTGWVASDLDDPQVRRQWDQQRVELVHGVIAQMPPAYFDHSHTVYNLFTILHAYFRQRGVEPAFSTDVDCVLDVTVVYRADGVMLLPDDRERQLAVQRELGEGEEMIRSIRVAPTLVVESVSAGHERQDRIVKKHDYEGFGAPNYWIISAADRSLVCYRLDRGRYVRDAHGVAPARVAPSTFEGLTIPLADVFR